MDFIHHLPLSSGKSTIFVILDMLSKYAHFVATTHTYFTIRVARIFFDHVFKLHEMPYSIVWDRDPNLQVCFAKNYFDSMAQHSTLVPNITLKMMEKWSGESNSKYISRVFHKFST